MYDLRDLVSTGLGAKITHKVVESDTATNYSPDLSELLSTTSIIGLAIKASADAVDQYLPEGFVSIGRSISFEHTASTRIGMTVTVEVTVSDVQPLYIDLDIKVSDELGEIGFGSHRRSIVVREYLMQRAKKREQMQLNSRPI